MSSSTSRKSLVDLPKEVIENILLFLNSSEILALCQATHKLYTYCVASLYTFPKISPIASTDTYVSFYNSLFAPDRLKKVIHVRHVDDISLFSRAAPSDHDALDSAVDLTMAFTQFSHYDLINRIMTESGFIESIRLHFYSKHLHSLSWQSVSQRLAHLSLECVLPQDSQLIQTIFFETFTSLKTLRLKNVSRASDAQLNTIARTCPNLELLEIQISASARRWTYAQDPQSADDIALETLKNIIILKNLVHLDLGRLVSFKDMLTCMSAAADKKWIYLGFYLSESYVDLTDALFSSLAPLSLSLQHLKFYGFPTYTSSHFTSRKTVAHTSPTSTTIPVTGLSDFVTVFPRLKSIWFNDIIFAIPSKEGITTHVSVSSFERYLVDEFLATICETNPRLKISWI